MSFALVSEFYLLKETLGHGVWSSEFLHSKSFYFFFFLNSWSSTEVTGVSLVRTLGFCLFK